MSYKHLTLNERYQINAYKSYVKQKDIAKMIGVHPSTILRELKKGRGKRIGNYFPIASDDRAKEMQKMALRKVVDFSV